MKRLFFVQLQHNILVSLRRSEEYFTAINRDLLFVLMTNRFNVPYLRKRHSETFSDQLIP